MTNKPPETLAQALGSFRLSEILGWDLGIGLVSGGLAAWLGVAAPDRLTAMLPIAAGLVGVVIGAVVAGVAVMAALLDQEFLRKLTLIGREPVRYVAPLLFTVLLGVLAALAILGTAALPSESLESLRGLSSGAVGLLVVWTLTSLLRDLSMLVAFIRLQVEASSLPEDAIAKLSERDRNHG